MLAVLILISWGSGLAGLMKTYHAQNEYCLLSDFQQGFQVMTSIIAQLDE
jgi:acetylornithine deacetylase/succinyl-diaminopimelate desuccinylase-like protein